MESQPLDTHAQMAQQEKSTFLAQLEALAAAINREDYGEAQALLRQLQADHAAHPQVLYLAGALKAHTGEPERAIALMRQALKLHAGAWPEAHFNLGLIYKNRLQLRKALVHLAKAVRQTSPQSPLWLQAQRIIVGILFDFGRTQEAWQHLQTLLEAYPEDLDAGGLLRFYLPAVPGLSDRRRRAIYENWDRAFARPLLPEPLVFSNDPDPQRRLRVGYVSADFCFHAAAHDLYPLFAYADRHQVEIFAYAHTMAPDDLTSWFRARADHWIEIQDLHDKDVAARIRADQIDILVDCSGQTAGSRLGVFARKPAPIQISAFGFVFTTGMQAMDYQFSDAIATPPEREAAFSERLIHLPSQIHWAPLIPKIAALPVNEPPCLSRGYITFGSGNASYKLNEYVVALWAAILRQEPQSRLHLKHMQFGNPDVQDAFRQAFAVHGVEPERLLFSGKTPLIEQLCFYHDIDIALDPFPYTGGMTTCETLFMGVPVVVLDGDGVRTSASLVTLAGAPELIAPNPEAYVALALELARNPQRLAAYRRRLRAGLQASPVMQSELFARHVEAAYRIVWQQWCAQQTKNTGLSA